MGTIVKEIVVNAPVHKVFAYWKNFENFPRFMDNIESVQITGPNTSHWKSKGPLGTHAEWDAEILTVEEDWKISWKSTGGNVETHGAVTFHDEGNNQTRVVAGIEYTPPAGALGEAVAKLFADPDNQVAEDLQRFKSIAEHADF
jgi:uncharacterized membrane protein